MEKSLFTQIFYNVASKSDLSDLSYRIWVYSYCPVKYKVTYHVRYIFGKLETYKTVRFNNSYSSFCIQQIGVCLIAMFSFFSFFPLTIDVHKLIALNALINEC